MQGRATFLGHPVHQMLIVFPLGLLATSVVFDLLHLATRSTNLAIVSHWMLVAGLIGGVIAAPFGTIDWLAVPRGTRAKAIGALHGGGNLVVVLLFGASWWVRREQTEAPPGLAIVLSLLAGGLAGVTAWLGGELVSRLGVGVHDGAGVNAPSSLRVP